MGGHAAERSPAAREYASLFANIPQEIHVWALVYGPDGEIQTWRLLDANPAALTAWGGRKLEDVRGKVADDIFGAGSAARHLESVRRMMKEHATQTFDDYVPQAGKYLRFTTIPLDKGFITTVSDITAHETERRALDAILEAAPVGIIVTDAGGKVRRINAAGVEMWGPAETVVRHYTERHGWWADGSEREGRAVQPDEWPLARARRGQTSLNQVIDIEPLDRPGTRRTMLISGAPVRDSSGNIIGAVLAQMDVTERVRAEQQLRQALELRDTFLRIAAHELRTPLTTLGLRLESLQELAGGGQCPDERLLERVVPAKRQADRLTSLVEDLLIVSRINSGALSIAPEDLDLGALVRRVAAKMSPNASRAGCELRLNVQGPVHGTWDRSHLEHALTSLIGNAIKYGPHQPIEIAIQTVNGAVEIVVRDRGMGVSEAEQQRIFGAYERAVSADHYGGLGLGLFITRAIAQAHGGTLTVESALGQGSAFTIRLPPKALPQRS